MEEKFSLEEQKAIANVLYHLANADYENHQQEQECVDACLKEIGFDATGFVPVSRSELPTQTYDTIKKMTKSKKRSFSLMMTRISRSDEEFGSCERKFVIEILETCDVPFVHK